MTSPLERLSVRRALALYVTVAIPAIVAARRDLADRQPHQVRGNYDAWQRLTWLPGPSIAYLVFARKPRAANPDGAPGK